MGKHICPFLVLALYLLTRLTLLTALPVFNDEAIYLHWGWKAIDYFPPAFLYVSLFDGKQPFLMWIFGIFEHIFNDPIFAGRIVSVLFGLGTCIGVYQVGKNYFSKKTGILAAFLYTIIPIFCFYDRQALMESSIAAIGIWTCFLTVRHINKKKLLTSLLIGILLGVGLFIKTTPIIFLASSICLLTLSFLKKHDKWIPIHAVIIILTSQIILLPLYNQFDSIKIITMNNRYALTVTEVFRFPFLLWIQHIKDSFEVLFFYLTPPILFFSIFGIYYVFREKNMNRKYILVWLTITLICFLLSVRNVSTRYIAPFLPVFSVFAAYAIEKNWNRLKAVIMLAVIPPFAATLLLLFSPAVYIASYSGVTKFANTEYVNGWTSGYGINETVSYLTNVSKTGPIHVEVLGDTGNPEDAMFVFFRSTKNVKVTYMSFTCTKGKTDFLGAPLKVPVYFISRDNHLENFGPCLQEVKRIYKPDRKNYIGIYKVSQ